MTDEQFAAQGYQPVLNNPPTLTEGQRCQINGWIKNGDGDYEWNYEVIDLDQNYLTNLHIRHQRDILLNDTDWSMLPDSPLSADDKAAYETYRQALRDLPSVYPEVKSPDDVTWPTAPWAYEEAAIPEEESDSEEESDPE
ncbi:MAG: hypothetical protein CMO44_18950 [Verrucomicrobiales bacterium]|nr:hypothetical protein [Verrucomicrobiales bacterium]